MLWKSDDTVKCIYLNGVHCKVWDVKCVNKNVMESGNTVKYDDIYAGYTLKCEATYVGKSGYTLNVKLH